MSLKQSDFSSDFCFLIFFSFRVCLFALFKECGYAVCSLYVSFAFVVYLVIVMSCTSKTTCK